MIIIKKSHYIAVVLILAVCVAFAAWKSSQTEGVQCVTEVHEIIREVKKEPVAVQFESKTDTAFVGVWIPYISLAGQATEQAFKAKFISMLEDVKAIGGTAVFVHIRPFSDTFYPSQLEPWSHILTGTQGRDPGYDPLAFMIEQTHQYGMEFHAWVNPFRISTGETPDELAVNSFYTKYCDTNPEYFLINNGEVYCNPAENAVRSHIISVITEIIEKYNADGIHFDDYFYPEENFEMDKVSYLSYVERTEEPLDQQSWRAANVNTFIASVYHRIKQTDQNIIFGISPQGNMENNTKIGADVYTWCAQNGYVDYICPQLYYPFESDHLSFENALNNWTKIKKESGIQLYIGLAAYKAGTEADNGAWKEGNEIIRRQIELCKSNGVDGIVIYSVENCSEHVLSATLQKAISSYTSR